MYVCIYVCMYIYIYTYIHIHIHSDSEPLWHVFYGSSFKGSCGADHRASGGVWLHGDERRTPTGCVGFRVFGLWSGGVPTVDDINPAFPIRNMP